MPRRSTSTPRPDGTQYGVDGGEQRDGLADVAHCWAATRLVETSSISGARAGGVSGEQDLTAYAVGADPGGELHCSAARSRRGVRRTRRGAAPTRTAGSTMAGHGRTSPPGIGTRWCTACRRRNGRSRRGCWTKCRSARSRAVRSRPSAIRGVAVAHRRLEIVRVEARDRSGDRHAKGRTCATASGAEPVDDGSPISHPAPIVWALSAALDKQRASSPA